MLKAGGEGMDAQKTGALIGQARREKGLTQKELAQALHVSPQAVSKWERGLNFPDLALLEALSDQLGLTVSELLSGTPGEPPQEKLLRDSLHLLLVQAGRKLRRWRRATLACAALLALLALAGGFWLVSTRTELLPQSTTVVSPSPLSEQALLAARTAKTASVHLYDLTVADGMANYKMQMELWTDQGLVQTWTVAQASNWPDAPRRQQLAFSYEFLPAQAQIQIGATMTGGTWYTTLTDVPYLGQGYMMDVLEQSCRLDPESGAVLACWSLPMLQKNGSARDSDISWAAPGYTGPIQTPQLEPGEVFLLLRLTVSA